MSYQKEAEQTIERANITAEFYSWPQKYIIGLDPDAEQLETYKATVSSLLTIFCQRKWGKNQVLVNLLQQACHHSLNS